MSDPTPPPEPCEACQKVEAWFSKHSRFPDGVPDFHHALLAEKEEALGEAIGYLARYKSVDTRNGVSAQRTVSLNLAVEKFLAAHPPKEEA